MAEILFNKSGLPLMAFGKNSFITTKGGPSNAVKGQKPERQEKVPAITEDPEDKGSVGPEEFVEWGEGNNFPIDANDIISSVGVLNTGLRFMRNFTIGQGIFPCKVMGYDEFGNEIYEKIDDEELVHFCESRMVRRYLEKAGRDYFKFGLANVELIPDLSGKKMVGINTINSMYARYTAAKDGRIEKIIISPKWPDVPGAGEYKERPLLGEYDPLDDLMLARMEGLTAKQTFVFPVRDSWSNADYYSEPIWWSAYRAGWIDVARIVPTFLKRAYQNQITWKWHVQIPYSFWERKFPDEDYPDKTQREQKIQEYLDALEENLTSHENADKTIITFFEINPQNGKAEEQWIIQPLDNKYKENDKLVTSAAANSEILFSLMINPNVLGAGMPGGPYAGNQGGSNIREAFLVNIANAWIDRQNLLDPLEAFLLFNGIEDVQLRFRSTILTTLDSGAGSKKILS